KLSIMPQLYRGICTTLWVTWQCGRAVQGSGVKSHIPTGAKRPPRSAGVSCRAETSYKAKHE
ncbi:MAG: hypothetical protein ACXW3J_07170, partial [Methylocystis sp.]